MRRMTGKGAPATFAGVAPSGALIEIGRGGTVLTGGAETVGAMWPDASAPVLPNAPPPMETGAPAVKPKPVMDTGAPVTKQAPCTAMPEAWAAAGAAGGPPTPPPAAGRTFICVVTSPNECGCRLSGRGRSHRFLPRLRPGEPARLRRASATGSHPSKTGVRGRPIVAVMSDQTIFPALRYRDAPAAIDWLGRAFGFEARMV